MQIYSNMFTGTFLSQTNCPKDIGINSKCETVAYFGAVLEACKDMDRELKAMNEHLNQLAGARKNVYSKYFPYATFETKQVNVWLGLRSNRQFEIKLD